MKKAAGIIFWIVALFSIIGTAGNLTSKNFGNSAETLGYWVGSMIPTILYVLSGIFLFNFENVHKLSYINGVKARQKQNVKIFIYMIIYALLLTVSIYSSFYPIFKAIDAESDGIAYAIVKAVISILPYMIPMFIFSTMYGMYALCINGCKKNFGYSDAMLSEYLGDESVFKPISKDGTILASEKAIYYKNLYCIIPFDQITSVEKINILIEQDVYFHLNNGKKIEIASKQYDCVKEAFDSYKATV